MATVIIKCPNCGGEVDMDVDMKQGFCIYCGQKVFNKPDVPAVVNVINTVTDSDKFYVIFEHKGVRNKHMIKDEMTLSVVYRKDAMYRDKDPLMLTASSCNVPLDLKIHLSNVPLCKIRIVNEMGTLYLYSDKPTNISINRSNIDFTEREIDFDDIIEMGKATITFSAYGQKHRIADHVEF